MIVFLMWFSVQFDVMVNAWFGYNRVQQALGQAGRGLAAPRSDRGRKPPDAVVRPGAGY